MTVLPRINCYFPITLRITGRPSDAQLDQLGDALARALAERMAFAERTLAAHHGAQAVGGKLMREGYAPGRADDEGGSYSVPSYQGPGQSVSLPLQTRGQPWYIRRAINFHAYVGGFLGLLEESDRKTDLGTEAYMDLYQELRPASAWLVQVNRDYTLREIKEILSMRARQLSRLRSDQFIFFGCDVTEEFRRQIIELDQDGIVASEIPSPDPYYPRRVEYNGDEILIHPGGRVLFASMVLPRIELRDVAIVGREVQLQVRLRDLTFLVPPVRFQQRFYISWQEYLRELGDEPATLRLLPVTVARRTNIIALEYLVEQMARQQLHNESGPLTESEVYYGSLKVLNDAALGKFPPAVRSHAEAMTDATTRRLDGIVAGDLEPNYKAAHVYTVFTISQKSVDIARYRPEAGRKADRLIPLIRERAVTADRVAGLRRFLKQEYPSLDGVEFEFLLDELKRRDNGRWFGRLFQATKETGDYDLRILVITLAKRTKYASDPQVLDLVNYHNERHRGALDDEYNVREQKIILNKLLGDKTVSVGNVLREIHDSFVHKEQRYKLKSKFALEWQRELLREREELIGRIERGEDPKGRESGYTDSEFAEAVLKAVMSRYAITEDNYRSYFDIVTIELSVRFLGLKKVIDDLGIETVYVSYRIVQREADGGWKDVGEVLQDTDTDFNYKLSRWIHHHVSSVIITIAHISLAIAAVGVAWEFGVVQALTRIAGGAKVVIPSIILSTVFEVIFNGFTFESFLLGAINGYLGALFFRGAGLLTRGAFGPSITTATFREGMIQWVGVRLFRGAVGGGSTGAATQFTHDVYAIVTGRGTWSSPADYAESIIKGVVIGVGVEYAGPILVEPLLRGLGGKAIDVARLLRANGVSPARWEAWSAQALSGMKQSLGKLMVNLPERAAIITEGFKIAFKQVGEALASLGREIKGGTARQRVPPSRQLPPGPPTRIPPSHQLSPVTPESGLPPSPPSTPQSGGGAPGGRGASLLQRQRAAALRTEAASLERRIARLRKEALKLERQAAALEVARPDRAARIRRQIGNMEHTAATLEEDIARLRNQADEFERGLRSATEDLPGSEDIDLLFAQARSETELISVPLSIIERNPSLLPRLLRPILRSRTGNRVVFRAEGGSGRRLVHTDPDRNVTITRGSTIHLNFGSPDRAAEFLMKNRGRLVIFEVDEAWVQSVRSAAIPEHGTKALRGRQPRLVDVRFAEDQMEIPANLIDELQQFIIPKSGRTLELTP
jgi:hypothetical protein